MAGFTPAAVDRVEKHALRPIILVEGSELRAWLGRIHDLVMSKHSYLIRRQKVFFDASRSIAPTWLTKLPDAGISIVSLDGSQHPYWESLGGFNRTAYALRILDIDWNPAGGTGIVLDLNLDIESAADLVELMKRLSQLGWITGEGSWRIDQSAVSWNGFGPAGFAEQVEHWTDRYRGRDLHHSEHAMYVDQVDDGIYTLAADIAAFERRRVSQCNLSFQLPGIPLDPSPFQSLIADLPTMNTPVFRPRNQPAVVRHGLFERQVVREQAYLVRVNESAASDASAAAQRWVEGVVIDDPLTAAASERRMDHGLPPAGLGSFVSSLRSHHTTEDAIKYQVRSFEYTDTTDARVVRVVSDWAD